MHLWERDCSTQRRHQKLIEESPAPRLPPDSALAMCEAAVRLIREAGYTNAGTVEFIVDPGRQFLLHRGQRPHPGRASGDRDGHRHRPDQDADSRRRRASRCRSSRSDIVHRGRGDRVPHQRRRPGKQLSALARQDRADVIAPGGFGVRFDSHAHTGYAVPPYYDSMIGKLIVYGDTRAGDRCMRARCPNCASKGSRPPFRCIRSCCSTRPSCAAVRPSIISSSEWQTQRTDCLTCAPLRGNRRR